MRERTIRFRIRTALGVMAAIALSGFPAPDSSAAATRDSAPVAAASSVSEFHAMISSGESFTDMVIAARKASGAVVTATLQAMLSWEESGHPVYIPMGTGDGVINVLATRADLTAALAAVSAGSPQAIEVPALPAKPSPQQYPVRGARCNRNRSWCYLKFELEAVYCDNNQCEKTDDIKVRMTVDPGVRASRASFTALYIPDDHSFTDIHFQWSVFCFAAMSECGSDNTASFSGNGSHTFTMTSDENLYDSRVTHALTLWALFLRNRSWYDDDARTGTAVCAKKPNKYCVY